ncbi:TetR/AcrR family transcriptional regulator [Amycolatopsis cihanbeyliensis]|uniref:TetR family transcriptional regulator n=1 Tax=Amycolatopsis cihanbeyliensis TaxID=1128664 RepID=A0A542DRC2_AMYCI|nr:TetR/AcrR family transcriptional regulator [Amycolatopsis cihanbeyliensis]TQJ05631.1 TetR family transcriptional regulator [Amycolatopsis cihanbeyliensis]
MTGNDGNARTSPRREKLLAAAVQYFAEHGLADISLRGLATELGTSHRMLIYHFGSKEGLLVAVVRAVEARQRAILTELAADSGLTPGEQARRMWRQLADPATHPHARLFFELYGQALQGREHTTPLLEGLVHTWLGPLTALAERAGMPPERARAHARLALATARGLVLDLLTTNDREAVQEAAELFFATYAAT